MKNILTIFSLALFFFLLFFSNDESYGFFVQTLAAVWVFFTALFFVVFVKKEISGLNFFSLGIFIVFIVSLICSIFFDGEYVFLYSITFGMVSWSLYAISARVTFEQVFLSIVVAYLASFVLILGFYGADLLDSLSLSANRWEVRFRPFGLHPNLTGYIYSGAVIVFGYFAIVKYRISWIFALFCLVFVVAAQARGGLLALVLSGGLATVVFRKKINKSAKIWGMGLSIISVLFVAANFELLLSVTINLLDLDSDTRGIDSGGTGRFDLWKLGIDYYLDSGLGIVVGSGLRSSSAEIIGFSTESSYITMLIDSGFLGFIAVMLGFGKNIVSLFNCDQAYLKSDHVRFFLFMILVFALLQGVVNRYLLAIGNPFSAWFLLLNFQLAFLNKKTV